MSLILKVIQDQSESNSERGKDKNFYLSEEAGLTPLLGMTQSCEDCDWLVVQEGNKRVLLRVGFIISLHFEITGLIWPFLPFSLSLSLSLSHARTHTHVGFYGLRGLSIGVMVFILYKLYVLLPYTYPTPKLSPHRRRCISTFPSKKLTLYDL